MSKRLIITIDGLAGVGKTTISNDLANLLGYKYVSTGWYYRCVAMKAIEDGVDINNESMVIKLSDSIRITLVRSKKNTRIFVDGNDATEKIFTPLIVSATATISTYPDVRKKLLPAQRRDGQGGGVVVEGRDAGTIVFPEADYKFYILASFEIRLKRLFKLLTEEEKKKYSAPESLTAQLEAIDHKDLLRQAAPTKAPEGAIVYDNSDSPSPLQDAYILQYYLTHAEEIISNSHNLRQKLKI